jgi:hypothetical protein
VIRITVRALGGAQNVHAGIQAEAALGPLGTFGGRRRGRGRPRPGKNVTAAYAPIGDYALIGDCRAAGLVSRDGSLDWLCLPRFDSPALFAALLDDGRGGRCRLRPVGAFRSTRRYLPDTNVLETTFRTETGAVALRDLMPVSSEEEKRARLTPDHQVLREL